MKKERGKEKRKVIRNRA